jgi:hypothetical protein
MKDLKPINLSISDADSFRLYDMATSLIARASVYNEADVERAVLALEAQAKYASDKSDARALTLIGLALRLASRETEAPPPASDCPYSEAEIARSQAKLRAILGPDADDAIEF